MKETPQYQVAGSRRSRDAALRVTLPTIEARLCILQVVVRQILFAALSI
jgi:hypothetical protein